ncbi:MAG: hypothetical protein LBR84_03680 [Tannerella sp.]|jgi:hypothetical protein|nr:hypothetical protein [Tannerella sp.]
MATYTVSINERLSLGKSILALLQSAKGAVSFEMEKPARTKVREEDTKLYKDLDSAMKEVKMMIDGKKPEKSAFDLLHELRNQNN